MLRSKHILLFIVLLFVGAQCFASQSVVLDSIAIDAIDTIETISIIDSVELADAEFEAWLEKYATVNSQFTIHNSQLDDTTNAFLGTIAFTDSTECVSNDSVSISLDIVKDSVEKRDFVELVDEGEEARERERNALIASVMASFKKKVADNTNNIDQANRSDQSNQSNQTNQPDQSDLSNSSDLSDQFNQSDLSYNFQLPAFKSADSLLAVVDYQLSTLNSQHSTKVNPLFLDWVIGGVENREQGTRSKEYGVWSDDSIVVEIRIGAKDYIRATAPELYSYHKSDLPSINELQISRIAHADRKELLLNLDTLNRSKTSQLKVDLPEISKWSKGAKFQVHASQNYISSNWYKGGESNLAATFYAMGYFNYDNRKGLQWDNKAEWKLGLYGMASDSLRWLRVNEDLLRLNSKLGYKAFKNFYYTAEWDFQTSLFNTYKSNTYVRSSGPFSPIRMSLSLGMDYKYKSIVSVFVSPLSYKLVYVADMSYKEGVLPEENIAYQVGITDGTRQSNQLGALIRTDFDYDFNESIGMEVHFSFFGNYVGKIKGVEVGCEVIGNFKINRFLSAQVSLYPRYDSTTVPADGGKPKMQFYELISLGFNYKL